MQQGQVESLNNHIMLVQRVLYVRLDQGRSPNT